MQQNAFIVSVTVLLCIDTLSCERYMPIYT
ncbi:hypothetical protein VIM7927_02888 [Vibrio mangrovi]|uniref:Uncharacterized protein n=1 Tax=Vibrio mangrovi TaxID=474394 RepID=A0A1Y6IYL9_9VIBR|nr:hypothetical protein VIM7927_02888 [Vibrio mangrovi]